MSAPMSKHLVIDPDDRIWLLTAEGRIDRRISREEIGSWAEYTESHEFRFRRDPDIVLTVPAQYRGIPWTMTRVDWAGLARLRTPEQRINAAWRVLVGEA